MHKKQEGIIAQFSQEEKRFSEENNKNLAKTLNMWISTLKNNFFFLQFETKQKQEINKFLIPHIQMKTKNFWLISRA